jgi:hypothetical protein
VAVIEIEIDDRLNRSLSFTPIQSVVRGRLDFMRGDAALRVKADDWPAGIPGQRVGFDTDTNLGYVAEPLHDPEFAAQRAKIEASGQSLPEKRRTFTGPGDAGYDWAATWVYWIKRAVESGMAKLLKGKLPAEVKGNVRKNFVTSDPRRSRQSAETANSLLVAMLTQEQRERFDKAMASQLGG